MDDGINFISGAAVVVTCFSHQERAPRHMGYFVCVVEPLDIWRWVTLGLADELFGITSEQRDYLWKLSGIDGGLICWEIITVRLRGLLC